MSVRLQVIGGGRMGQALIGGMIGAGWAQPAELAVVELLPEGRDHLAELFPDVQVLEKPLAGVDALVAVKPPAVAAVCSDLEHPSRVISIAAGITIDTIEQAVGLGVPILRVMPNTPSLVGAGAAAVAGSGAASEADIAWAVGILEAVGVAVVVPEYQMDAVTGLSGSGPAYVFLLAEALTDAGVAAGLTRDTAAALAHQTIYGAGKLLVESGENPVSLRAGVTTPAGTTAAGLARLEAGAFRSTVAEAVRAAADRSAELGA